MVRGQVNKLLVAFFPDIDAVSAAQCPSRFFFDRALVGSERFNKFSLGIKNEDGVGTPVMGDIE